MMIKQVWPMVIKDMIERNEMGAKKYNRYLQTDCPDNMLQHLYEELLDAAVYTKTQIEKQKNEGREALQKEKQEWMLKNIKNGQEQQRYIRELEKMDLTSAYISPLGYLVKQAKLQEK